jgi:hypothetical protein
MTGVARHHLPATEVVRVDLLHHRDHGARAPLEWSVVGVLAPIAAAVVGVAVGAVEAK